jgi:hypothetical protein
MFEMNDLAVIDCLVIMKMKIQLIASELAREDLTSDSDV